MKSINEEFIAIALLALGLAPTILSLLQVGQHVLVDDAFIFLRVADSVTNGTGWGFNPNEVVNSLTSPLMGLCLLLFVGIGVSGVAAITALHVIGVLGIASVQYVAFRRVHPGIAVVIALVTATSAALTKSAGLETSLFISCTLAAFLFFERKQWLASGVFIGAAVLARPDGLAAALVILAALALRPQRRGLLTVGCLALMVLPWQIFSIQYFGELVPHSAKIKALQSETGYWATLDPWFRVFLDRQRVLPLVLVTFAAGLIFAIRRTRNAQPYALFVAVFGVLQIGTYALANAPSSYFWYFAPGDTAVLTIMMLGLWWTLRAAFSRLRFLERRANVPSSAWLGWGMAMLVLLVMGEVGVKSLRRSSEYRFARQYSDVASWLAANTTSDESVACAEIGILGYGSGLSIVDMHGLIHKGAEEFIGDEGAAWWFHHYQPVYIVAHDPPWYGEPDRNEWSEDDWSDFSSAYEIEHRSGTVLLFGRRDAPNSE